MANNSKLFKIWINISLTIMLVLILNSVIGDIYFRMKYSFPKVTKTTKEVLDPTKEPIQINLNNAERFYHQGEKNKHVIQPMAEYSITGLTVATNTNLWLRDVMRNDFDDIALMDIGLTWGSVANPNYLKEHKLRFKSSKTLGQSRQLSPKGYFSSSQDVGYFTCHFSHTHLVPANDNVMGALLTIKKGQVVKLEGYLIDQYSTDGYVVAKTSLSRADKNSTARGGGACEIMYVKQVQIGDKVYE